MTKLKNRRVYSGVALLVASGGVSLGLGLTAGGPMSGASNAPAVAGFEAGLSPAKAAIVQRQVSRGSETPPAPKNEAAGASAAAAANPPAELPTSGIYNSPQGPFEPGQFLAENSWGGEVGGEWLWVYAGQVGDWSPAAAQLGGVAVYSQALNGLSDGSGVTYVGTVTVPGVTSPLKIMSAVGGSLTLTDAAGQTFSFNLSDLSFGSTSGD